MNRVEFNEQEHTYTLYADDGTEKQLTSVTALLKKHGITADYGKVPDYVLAAKAEYGKLVHKEIESYIKTGEIGMTEELVDYVRLMAVENLEPKLSESIVYNSEIAGTFDLLAASGSSCVLVDFKTTAKLDVEALRWQLSLYNYLSADKSQSFLAFHLRPAGKSKSVEIEPISTEEVEALLKAEREGRIYQKNLPTLEAAPLQKLAECEMQIATLKNQIAAFEDIQKTLYDEIYSAMEERGIKSYESELLKLTYVAPTTKQTLDGKRIEKELPEIYQKYLKVSPVKGSLRVKLKGEA